MGCPLPQIFRRRVAQAAQMIDMVNLSARSNHPIDTKMDEKKLDMPKSVLIFTAPWIMRGWAMSLKIHDKPLKNR